MFSRDYIGTRYIIINIELYQQFSHFYLPKQIALNSNLKGFVNFFLFSSKKVNGTLEMSTVIKTQFNSALGQINVAFVFYGDPSADNF